LAEGGTIEERIKDVYRICDCKWPVRAVNHYLLTGHDDLSAREREIVAGGGEGIVIRRPGCLYRPGRAGDVIKVKRLVADVDRWQG
jgi:hypothetical protein